MKKSDTQMKNTLKKKYTPWRSPWILFTLTLFLLAGISGCSSLKTQERSYRNAEEMYYAGVKQYQAQRYEEAEQILELLLERYPLNHYAIDGEIMLADALYAEEKYDEARVYYTNFVALHPSYPKAPYALFQKGMCFFRNVLTLDRDQTTTRKAILAFEDLSNDFPDSSYNKKAEELIAFLRKRLAEREMYVGRFYLKKKNYKGALARFKVVLDEYPDSKVIDEILFYIVKSYVKLGEEIRARDVYATMQSDFPQSSYTRAAEKIIKG